MKTCPGCKQSKPLDEYGWLNKAKNQKASRCFPCARASSRKSYAKHQTSRLEKCLAYRKDQTTRFAEYKSTLSCTKCGESDSCCLDFHHLRDKDDEVSHLVKNGYSWERIQAEIAKCVVLCKNCHTKAHKHNWIF